MIHKLNKYNSTLILIITAFLWGSGFIANKVLVDMNMSASFMLMVRSAIYSLCVFVVFFKRLKFTKKEVTIGIIVGAINAIGFILQTIGVKYTSPSNNAFLTTTNVIMVPFIVFVFFRKKPKLQILFSIVICLIGMAILTNFTSFSSINKGDILTLLCALFFAVALAIIGEKGDKLEFSSLSLMIGLTQMIFAFFYFIFIGKNSMNFNLDWGKAIFPLIYLGIFCSFIAQTGQLVGQKKLSSSTSAIILTLEGVFGALLSVIVGYEKPTISLFAGGTIMIISLILAEYEFKGRKKKDNKQS